MNRDDFNRMSAPLIQRVRLMVARAVVRLVDSSRRVQAAQVGLLKGEARDSVEMFEHYGFTSCPLPGMEAAVMFVGGDRSSGVIVAVGDRMFRLQGLQPGEVALYTDEGDSLVFKRGRTVELTTLHARITAEEDVAVVTKRYEVTATEGVAINSPSYVSRGVDGGTCSSRMEGAVHVTGDVTSDADVQAGSVSLRTHVHPENGGSGPTGSPVGG
ncbi:phage baseplate assembly protein V [Nitratidesulfovibrio liaohensis]|uniref:phage baseplate assembly protein V n=1 Tax=Nitratidesulfovibrio liaohensis TaxID=2604158 RepID=UPI00141D839A|nr:phage baseplate assembly protein V [Nitratidesulfovibrio liaohensis]NHZ45513.1 phage baseplate assembly protein V [Nitratidesulfovibrio liaohensis]